MPLTGSVEPRVWELMCGYRSVGDASVSVDTLTKALRLSTAEVDAALKSLLSRGRIEHARKNPRSASARYRIKDVGGAAK
jgi:hypothetical protein